MTQVTLRPTSSINAGAVVGAASAHAAASDDSDASYFVPSATVTGLVTTGSLASAVTAAIVAGGVTKSIRLRCRGISTSPSSIQLRRGGTTLTTLSILPGPVIAGMSGNEVPVTLGEITGGSDKWISFLSSSVDAHIHELYADLTYVARPTLTVSVTDPWVDGSMVTVGWTPTLDVDGGSMDRNEVYVFTPDVYGVLGFSPDSVDKSLAAAAVINHTAATTATVGPLPNGTYRAYVRVSQMVNGVRLWSAWVFDEFTVDVDTAEIEAVALTADDENARNQVTIERTLSSHAWERVSLERSDDAGVTWVPVRGATWFVPDDASQVFVDDNEAPSDVNVIYRARAAWQSTGGPVVGDWVESPLSVSWHSEAFWVKAPGQPAFKLATDARALPSPNRPIQQGVFKAPRAKFPIVISGRRQATTGTIVFQPESDDAADLLLTLLELPVLLLQAPRKLHRFGSRYISPGEVVEDWVTSTHVQPLEEFGWFAVTYTEVERPPDLDAGVL